MKKVVALVLVFVLCVSMFAACGKGGSKKDDQESRQEGPKGTQYDTGAFTVFVPEGWKEFVVYDVFAEEDNTADPNALQIIKDGKNSLDVFSKPYIDIRYYGPDTQGVAPYKELYDEVEDIEPLELDNFTFTGFECVSFDVSMTILWADDGINQFQLAIYTDQEDGDIMITDEDVMMIIESIVPSAGIQENPKGESGSPAVEADYMLWSGYWYGWWCVTNATGKFAEVDNWAWDVVAYNSVWDDSGEMTIWDSETSWSNPLMEVDVAFTEGSTEMGVLHVSEGDMFPYREWLKAYDEVTPMELEENAWVVEPADSSVSHFENMIQISGSYVDEDDRDNSFDYHIFLRPWGTDWEDVESGDTTGCIYKNMMPVLYESWYLPLLELGYVTAPDDFEIGFDRIEN